MDLITLIPATEVVPRVVLTLDEMGINGFPRRRDNKRNEFELVEIRDFQSSNLIFDGEGFYYKDIVMCDTDDLKINLSPNFRLIFNTPYISEEVPVSLEILLKNIRNRLKYLEGENGKFKNDLELKVKTEIKGYDVCLHGLHYRERESDFYFKGFTGWIDYRCSNLDSISQKLLGIGALLGGGVNASLGCGYFRIE
ncbi:MAG: CRISPR system precrRNA processing endoribonuclease RAMP protein Cas6 [Candidatus Helarchaeota archaeon]